MKKSLIVPIMFLIVFIVLAVMFFKAESKLQAKKFMRFDIQHKEKNEGNTIIVFYDIQTTKKYLVFESGRGGVGMVELKD